MVSSSMQSLLLSTTFFLAASTAALPVAGQRCTKANMAVRKEWGSLTPAQRISYTDSVKCLMNKPSKLPAGAAPGARSHYDDFIATHINFTFFIHQDGQFLPWHRQFLWLFEHALQSECNYAGALPYWNWPLWAGDLAASPLFDGSATSLSGDGVYNASFPGRVNGNYTFPRGHGGGCVRTGPFANLTLPFQRFSQDALVEFNGTLPADALDPFPHCFVRDLNSGIARHNTNASAVDYLINRAPSIANFQDTLDDDQLNTQYYGAHAGGHFSAGPDLGDIFASPSDPAFYLHHGMVDLLWTEWQAKDPKRRQYALSGTSTFNNTPPSANVTVDFLMDYGFLAPGIKIGDVMDVEKVNYCYRYDYQDTYQ